MGLMEKVFKNLKPPGDPFRLFGNLKLLFEAIAGSFETAKAFIEDVLTESNPGTADETLQRWYTDLGIKYDSTKTKANLQKRANQVYTSLGGQNLDYLNEQLQIAYPDVEIVENLPLDDISGSGMVGLGMVGVMMVSDYPSWISSPPTDGGTGGFYYLVTGEVDDVSDLNGIKNLLDRIAPLTMTPQFSVTIRNLTETAEVGLGMVGLMEVGKTKED